jgi:hypothetical protein
MLVVVIYGFGLEYAMFSSIMSHIYKYLYLLEAEALPTLPHCRSSVYHPRLACNPEVVWPNSAHCNLKEVAGQVSVRCNSMEPAVVDFLRSPDQVPVEECWLHKMRALEGAGEVAKVLQVKLGK